MRRIVVPELLDTDAGTPREVADSIADLRMFNRAFGGVRVMARLLERVSHASGLKTISWLDVAGSDGFLALQTRNALSHSGITADPVVLDRAPTHMDGRIPGVGGDALALPFSDNSFDAVSCSLFAHHLEPEELARFAREALRVARHAFLIHDLVRHPVHLALSYLGFPLYRSRITRHDAPASVRRAYTEEEMKGILGSAAPHSTVEIHRYYLYRMGVILWKQPPTI